MFFQIHNIYIYIKYLYISNLDPLVLLLQKVISYEEGKSKLIGSGKRCSLILSGILFVISFLLLLYKRTLNDSPEPGYELSNSANVARIFVLFYKLLHKYLKGP